MNSLKSVDDAGMTSILNRNEIPNYITACPECGTSKLIDYGGVYECAICEYMVGELETCPHCDIILEEGSEHLDGCEMRREYCYQCGYSYYGKHEHD